MPFLSPMCFKFLCTYSLHINMKTAPMRNTDKRLKSLPGG